LSRFDLIFILVDQQNTDYDLAQANFKLAFSRNEEEDD
jgi:DNA replicative helicase MCM subunit Mcm2 (Cdc46/Mcm family)